MGLFIIKRRSRFRKTSSKLERLKTSPRAQDRKINRTKLETSSDKNNFSVILLYPENQAFGLDYNCHVTKLSQ